MNHSGSEQDDTSHDAEIGPACAPGAPASGAHQAETRPAVAHDAGGTCSHHAHMVADYRRRFWFSLILSVPTLLLSPLIQETLGVDDDWDFSGDSFILCGFATAIFFYGGWPFLTGILKELRSKSPGMMTLIAVAITTAYVYSTATTFGVSGDAFFWEIATLIDVMLLGHWLEMRSITGASRALEALVSLMPAEAHKVGHDGVVVDIPVVEASARRPCVSEAG